MGIQLDYENDLGFNYIGQCLLNIPEEVNAELLPKALMGGAHRLANRIRKHAKQAFNWEHHFKDRNPPRPFGLYDSIRVGKPTAEHWPDPYVRVGAGYARQVYLIEHGHLGKKPAPPHPFIIPAVLQGEDDTIRAVTNYMRQHWVDQVMNPAIRNARSNGNRKPQLNRQSRPRGVSGGSIEHAASTRGRGRR